MRIEFGRCGSKGIYLRINDTFREFFWQPYSDGWIDAEGRWHKSKKYQYLKFTLGHTDPRKGNNMNAFTQMAPTEPAKLTDEQLEQLLAIAAEPVPTQDAGSDGDKVFISTDAEDETDDQKVK